MWRYLTGCILIVIGAYFYMIFPGMGRKREIWKFRGTQWAHRGLHDKRSEFRKIRWRLFGKQYGQTKELSWMYI